MKRTRDVSTDEGGGHISGRMFTYGQIPPAAGPGRVAWCLKYGSTASGHAHQALGRLLRDLIVFVPGGLRSLPGAYPLEIKSPEPYRGHVGRARVEQWFSLRRSIEARDKILALALPCVVIDSPAWLQAEREARSALQHCTEALHCLRAALEEMEHAMPLGTDELELAQVVAAAEQMVGAVHRCAHAAGEIVGGLFGCRAEYSKGEWVSHCLTELLHVELGFSVGFTAQHLCSICDQDLAMCDHIPGTSHQVVVSLDADGNCNACGEETCAHVPGDLVDVVAAPVIREANIHEVSLTPRPRDPRNRLDSVGLGPDMVRERLGREPRPEEKVLLHGCMYPCRGFGNEARTAVSFGDASFLRHSPRSLGGNGSAEQSHTTQAQ